MDNQKRYILSLELFMMGITVVLSALSENRLDVYISLYTVAYFASTALFQPRKRTVDLVGGSLFLVFSVIVAQKIWEILR